VMNASDLAEQAILPKLRRAKARTGRVVLTVRMAAGQDVAQWTRQLAALAAAWEAEHVQIEPVEGMPGTIALDVAIMQRTARGYLLKKNPLSRTTYEQYEKAFRDKEVEDQVLELTTDPSTFGPTGAIVRVKPNGTRSVIGRDVLHYPGGMEIGAGGSIFVSNWSVLPAFPQAGSPFGNARGQVIRLTP